MSILDVTIDGEINETGSIQARVVKGTGLVISTCGAAGEFFLPLSRAEVQTAAERGLLYRKVRIKISFEQA